MGKADKMSKNKQKSNSHEHNGMSRREFLRNSTVTMGGLMLAGMLPARLQGAVKKVETPHRAKSIIEIWMWGGPSHLETFDPKPDAGSDYNGGKTAIPTNVKGMYLSEYLPQLAKCADKFSIIRSMTHGINGHETATYIMQTGRKPDGQVFPAIGAVVGLLNGRGKGYEGKIPPYVVLTQNKGRFSESGFLNPRYKPLVTGGRPESSVFIVEGIVAKNITQEQQLKRRKMLQEIDTMGRALPDNKALKQFDQAGEEAYDLIAGNSGKVFDLNQETKEVRDRYGRNHFGQSCLAARRLVEQGVPYITINAQGWDTHKKHFDAMRRKLPEVDQGLSALLEDLDKKGLLDSTIIWCSGEFGRGPKIQTEEPWNGGRSHFGKCFSALVAGGGFKGGCVVGSSDRTGENVATRPVYPQDLLGSIYELAGIDPDGPLPNPMGKNLKILPPESKQGRLREIYKYPVVKK